MDDTCLRETTAKILQMIRQYPYARLVIGTRAALAFYEILQALTFLKAKKPLLTAALITLPHRVKSESVNDSEKIIKDIVTSFENNGQEQKKITEKSVTPLKIVQILRELDNLQDMTYAMPYEINILDPQWFKFGQESIFRPEAPTLMAQTLNWDKKPDFTTFKKILEDLQNKGFIRLKSDGIRFTRSGSLIKYKNVFSYVEWAYPKFFSNKLASSSHSGDDRSFHWGDSYKDIHLRRTLRTLVKKRKDVKQVLRKDIRIKKMLSNKKCMVVMSIDHSWSMARSKKLQYVKDSSAGLIFAVKRNRDKIALIAFSDEAVVLSQPTSRYGLLIEKISRLRPEKETDVTGALIKTRMLFSKTGNNYLKHSIIITDGIPTSSCSDVTRTELEGRILLEVNKMRKTGITVSVICIRDELEENDTSLARKMASIGRGSFSLVNTQDLLDHILRDYSNKRSMQAGLL